MIEILSMLSCAALCPLIYCLCLQIKKTYRAEKDSPAEHKSGITAGILGALTLASLCIQLLFMEIVGPILSVLLWLPLTSAIAFLRAVYHYKKSPEDTPERAVYKTKYRIAGWIAILSAAVLITLMIMLSIGIQHM